MSFTQRFLPLIGVTFVGVGIGVYVFDPLLKQYAKDTNYTFRPPPPGSTTTTTTTDDSSTTQLQGKADELKSKVTPGQER